jgi:hypothetical protein
LKAVAEVDASRTFGAVDSREYPAILCSILNIYENGYFATISIGVANRQHISLSVRMYLAAAFDGSGFCWMFSEAEFPHQHCPVYRENGNTYACQFR